MKGYQNRPVTANAILIDSGKILLIKRVKEPFKDCWAVPGGFTEVDETTSECALRELQEETGITAKINRLVGVYDTVGRDPRYTVNISYLVESSSTAIAKGGDDAKEAKWFPMGNLPKLAFDHKSQIIDALKLIK